MKDLFRYNHPIRTFEAKAKVVSKYHANKMQEFIDQAEYRSSVSSSYIEKYVWDYAAHLADTINSENDVMRAYEPPPIDKHGEDKTEEKSDYQYEYPDKEDHLRAIITVRAMILKSDMFNRGAALGLLDNLLTSLI